MQIDIRNCNNIDSGTIDLEPGRLNIKYALNGTGKSTIANAIKGKIEGADISVLKPFKHFNETGTEHAPCVEFSGDLKSIAIFNEEYIERHTYKQDELLENSFEIFVKTPQYEQHMERISSMVENIKQVFSKDEEFDSFVGDLGRFIDSFGRETQKGISKSSTLYKTIGGGNKLENLPTALDPYRPFLSRQGTNIDWIKWQTQGNNFLDITDKCPYCVSSITTPKETIRKVSEEFDTKYLKAISEIIDTFNTLKDYFTEETIKKVDLIYKNAAGMNDEHIEFLKGLRTEAVLLRKKLEALKNIGFDSLKDVEKVADELEGKKINLTFCEHLDSEFTKGKIEAINDSIDEVCKQAGLLQGEVNQQKREIRRTIEKHRDGINDFLMSAGYPYEVNIIEGENEQYRLILSYKNQEEEISEVKSHLSYGERNAFALVLFMYQTLKEDPDLIILDDPISSFDTNKKFAIITKLFRGEQSFKEKTVMMLTHDFEPVIDMIYTMSDIFQPTAKAAFLANINGVITEKPILRKDVRSFVDICMKNISESDSIIHKLIYYRRYLEVIGKKELAWDLVSNIFHKDRQTPIYNDEHRRGVEMSPDDINEATNEISQLISGFNYDDVYKLTQDMVKMIEIYKNAKSGYEKVQIFRLLKDGQMERGSAIKKYVDETFHVQNDYLFQLNPREYELVPQHIIDFCDSEIEKLANRPQQ